MKLMGLCYTLVFSTLCLSACMPLGESLKKLRQDDSEDWSLGLDMGAGTTHTFASRFRKAPALSSLQVAKNVSPELQDLKWSALNSRVLEMNTSSKKRCARGVKDSLATLFGRSKLPQDGIDACEITEDYLSKNFSKNGQVEWVSVPLATVAQKGLKPGDTVVCNRDIPMATFDNQIPCTQGNWGRLSGHIEMVDASGVMSSDFRQLGSGCLSSSRYHNARVYRPVKKGAMAQHSQSAAQFLMAIAVSSAHANTSPVDNSARPAGPQLAPETKILLAETGVYSVFEVEGAEIEDQDSSTFMYYVYEKQNNRQVAIAESDVSSFDAIASIKDNQARAALAAALVDQLVKEYSRENLQKKILERPFFTSAEKNAYLSKGFKIPEHFRITR